MQCFVIMHEVTSRKKSNLKSHSREKLVCF